MKGAKCRAHSAKSKKQKHLITKPRKDEKGKFFRQDKLDLSDISSAK